MATEYVMVPVPEEIVDEVRQFVTWSSARVIAGPLDPAPVEELLDQLDARSRTFLTTVAHGTSADHDLTVTDVATLLSCTVLEVAGMVMALNQRLMRIGGFLALLTLQPSTEPVERQLVAMQRPMAELVIGRTSGRRVEQRPEADA